MASRESGRHFLLEIVILSDSEGSQIGRVAMDIGDSSLYSE